MRNLMRTAISSVCYLRNLFPEDCFQDKSLSGIQIKSLQPSNEEARTLIDWLEKGVFEALKKKYLRTIIFGVCSDPSREIDSMLESYECKYYTNWFVQLSALSVKVTYPDKEEGQLNISRAADSNKTNKKIGIKGTQTKQEITQSMVMMLRTLITLAQTLQPIPETRYITMKLLYYEDVTPRDYEPSFFRALREDESRKFNQDFVKLKIGQVQTQYHSLNIRVRTASESFEDEDGKSVTSEMLSSCPIDKNNSHPTSSQWAVNVPENKLETKKEYDSDSTQLSQQDDNTKQSSSCEEKLFLADLEKIGWFNFQLKSVSKLLSNKYPSVTGEIAKELVIAKRTKLVKDMEDHEKTYYKALAYVLEEDHITASSLSSELDISSYSATKLISQMEKEGLLKAASTKRKGKKVMHNNKRLEEAKEFIEFEQYLKQPKTESTSSPSKSPEAKKKQEFDYSDSDSEISNHEESDIKPTPKKAVHSSPTVTSPPKQPESVDKRGVKRKTISQFEVSHSQDEITANDRENEENPSSSKVDLDSINYSYSIL
ncbi:meiotic specific asynaptic protein [Naegleria gruberi]|uniref:Meiotic specific asynaptic protein n=1 Tax=Naegleria gruberi TaxID=5762 RepID=D2VL39_NAEGR|nr:meiotic specific asynaptic protein [Naegleria gruberi]EFC42471.1 meiotic specific asynaptic protein [Naegleria gruberi]|eukprot:XP_002675215.1 meiotic specific asynaptic protein [Naegleria gruberi strain NEG-M]